MLWLCDGFTVPHPRLVAALLTRAEALLEGEALEEVKQLLIAATVPHNTRYSPAAADKTLVARLDQARQLAQDMTLPAPARTTFSETASTIKAVMDEEARQWRDDED